MKVFQKSLLLAFLLLYMATANAQAPASTDFYATIKKYDLAKLWRADQIQIEGSSEKVPFPEPLGFIGSNFQRFYIHYLSVTKSITNPYQYTVKGKTRVKDNICDFTGTVTILKARLYKESDAPAFKQGFIVCQVDLYEDSTQAASGFITGLLTSNFCIDKGGNIRYDALIFGGDLFSNNECEANWTSYKSHKSKQCNWGDYRIPGSKGLDIGTGEFIVDAKYIQFGWQTYTEAYGVNTTLAEKALKIENEEWWK